MSERFLYIYIHVGWCWSAVSSKFKYLKPLHACTMIYTRLLYSCTVHLPTKMHCYNNRMLHTQTVLLQLLHSHIAYIHNHTYLPTIPHSAGLSRQKHHCPAVPHGRLIVILSALAPTHGQPHPSAAYTPAHAC